MKNLKLLDKFVFLCTLFFASIVHADDMSDARIIAISILSKLEQEKNVEVWEKDVSEWFKERMTKDAFLANMTLVRTQLGSSPGVDRKLVQQNRADSDPSFNYKGDVFSFMFSTTFPGARVYEMIGLIREGTSYKLSGIRFIPNPNP